MFILAGCTQLKVIDSVLLGELLPRCMPNHWLSGEKVTWRPQEFGHPPESWLETVWDYLVKHSPKVTFYVVLINIQA